jgi:S-adenosylmethionine:tRNA ribosyltransferase-isomerase
MYLLSDYSYTLPDELIAQEAIHPAHDARLLIIDRTTGAVHDGNTFSDLPSVIPHDRVIYFNNSRVLRARIPLKNQKIIRPDGSESTLVKGEILFCEMHEDGSFDALVRPGAKFRDNTRIAIGNGYIEVIGSTDTGRRLRYVGGSIYDLMESHGELPLPPYIEYSREKESDYQTVFARESGSVAAPTASLHFTEDLMSRLPHEKSYLTLHVGLGTFRGIDVDDVRDYAIHREIAEVRISIFAEIYEQRIEEKKIVAVGTTVCRTLESLPSLWRSLDGEFKKTLDIPVQNYWNDIIKDLPENTWVENISLSQTRHRINFATLIYITPGYRFLVVDELITNFHLPESSLLVLVSAFLGYETTREIYQYAIEKRYRFYSFGDGMYIHRK